jgi:hypothetical protein
MTLRYRSGLIPRDDIIKSLVLVTDSHEKITIAIADRADVFITKNPI